MSTLNGFRWFMSIFAPLIVVVAIFSLIINIEDEFFLSIKGSNFYLYLLIHGIEMAITFMIFVVTSCLIAPSPKKNAAIIVAGISLTFLITLFYFARSENTLSIISLSAFIGVFFGLAIGVVVSRVLFKSRGWNAIKEVGSEPVEQY